MPQWGENSELVLQNTTARSVHDYFDKGAVGDVDSWPNHLQLSGFTYKTLGSGTGEQHSDMMDRSGKWFEKWLAREPSFSSQPYSQLATILREAGYPEEADAIRFSSRYHERQTAWDRCNIGRWAWLVLLQYSIGFGIGLYTFLVLAPITVLTLGGMLLLKGGLKTAERRKGWFIHFWTSLDNLLPIVDLANGHEVVNRDHLSAWALNLLYVQKMCGWVLGFFLVAAIAVLRKQADLHGAPS